MHPSEAERQARRAGGLARAALARTPQAITQAARDARWQRYIDRIRAVLPEITDDNEITRRAELLRRADMARMSAKSVKIRELRRRLRLLEAELDATGLDDTGSDGIDSDGIDAA